MLLRQINSRIEKFRRSCEGCTISEDNAGSLYRLKYTVYQYLLATLQHLITLPVWEYDYIIYRSQYKYTTLLKSTPKNCTVVKIFSRFIQRFVVVIKTNLNNC